MIELKRYLPARAIVGGLDDRVFHVATGERAAVNRHASTEHVGDDLFFSRRDRRIERWLTTVICRDSRTTEQSTEHRGQRNAVSAERLQSHDETPSARSPGACRRSHASCSLHRTRLTAAAPCEHLAQLLPGRAALFTVSLDALLDFQARLHVGQQLVDG